MNDGVSIAVSTPDRDCGRHGFESRTPTKYEFNMSIKIIKEGRKKKEVYETTCDKCDCIFEYNIEDVVAHDKDYN